MSQNKKKRPKIITKIVLYAFLLLFMLIFGTNLVLGAINYSHNKQLTMIPSAYNSDGIILSQNLLTDYKLGIENASKNSCGALATYNFLKLHNKSANFASILLFYDAYGTTLHGHWGINPFAIQAYLNLKGYNAKLTINTNAMNNLAKISKISILMYFHSSGAHYIVLNYNKQNNNFLTYNEHYGKIKNFNSVKEILAANNRSNILSVLIYVK